MVRGQATLPAHVALQDRFRGAADVEVDAGDVVVGLYKLGKSSAPMPRRGRL